MTSDFWAENEEIKIVATAKVMDSVACRKAKTKKLTQRNAKTNAGERKGDMGFFLHCTIRGGQVVVVGWLLDVILRFFGGAYVLLVFDEPHDPACDDGAADEEGEAEGSEADHHAGFGALGDAEDDRSEE